MRILFNLFGVGCGNNGGTLTLFKSANTLSKLGHDVKIVDSGKNQNTWFKLNVSHIVVKKVNEFPEADVIVATGVKSVDSTDRSNIKIKAWYIRGWETWVLPEEHVIRITKGTSTIKIVNSVCLQNKLKQYGIESTIIRPGYDFNEIYPLNIRKNNAKITLGGLSNQGKKWARKRCEWLPAVYSVISKKYDVNFIMFGTGGNPNVKGCFFFENPSAELKNKLYNAIDIWMAPTMNEGLHIPPAEAGLTECPSVVTNAEMSGTQDYIIDGVTGLVSENNLTDFTKKVEKLIVDKDLRINLSKNIVNKIKELGDRQTNMRKMVEIFEKAI